MSAAGAVQFGRGAAPTGVSRAAARLEELAQTDATVAPLARLLVVVQAAAGDPAWAAGAAGVPALDGTRLADGLPLLHGQALALDEGRVRALARRLAGVAAEGSGSDHVGRLRQALDSGQVDVVGLVEASVRQEDERVAGMAQAVGVPEELLATLGQLVARPALRAVGRAAAPLLETATWDAGYCPVCVAWPVLAERRGLERKRFLRCGRCGVGWSYGIQKCPFCGNHDYKTLGYLAPEAEREARQAATCDACMGYVKTVTSVAEIAPDDLDVQDLATLELDVAALEQGYARPEEPGFPLDVRVVTR